VIHATSRGQVNAISSADAVAPRYPAVLRLATSSPEWVYIKYFILAILTFYKSNLQHGAMSIFGSLTKRPSRALPHRSTLQSWTIPKKVVQRRPLFLLLSAFAVIFTVYIFALNITPTLLWSGRGSRGRNSKKVKYLHLCYFHGHSMTVDVVKCHYSSFWRALHCPFRSEPM